LRALKTLQHLATHAAHLNDVWAHRFRHGGRYIFMGRAIRLPPHTVLSLRHAIVTETYEGSKRELITQYMSSQLPVIELGARFGLLSGFISEHLGIEVDHLVIEADAALIDACRANAKTERRADKTKVLHKTISYSASGNQACRLRDVLPLINESNGYTLVCDIGGVEFDLFQQDADALQRCKTVVVEIHADTFETFAHSCADFLDLVRASGFQQVDHVDDIYAFQRA